MKWCVLTTALGLLVSLTACRDEAPEDDGFGFFVDGDKDTGRPQDVEEDATRDVGAVPDAPGLGDATADTRPDTAEPDVPDEPEVPDDPCAGVECGDHGSCDEGTCACEQGYELRDGRCALYDPGDPALRSPDLVCSRWADEHPGRARQIWSGGNGCEPGTIDPVAHEDAMRRLNLYRWLVGLEPAGFNLANQLACQKAAMMMDANNALSHTPPQNWRCYDPEGASAAGMSNLALGYANPADSIDGYIEDGGTPSLGHRRWIFFPLLDAVGFGHRGRGGAMYAFGRTNRRSPAFVAYPPPGPVPVAAIHGAWSFSKQGVGNPQVTVTEVGTDRALRVTSSALQQGFGLDTVSFQIGEQVRAGTTYRVQVGNTSYETTPVGCR